MANIDIAEYLMRENFGEGDIDVVAPVTHRFTEGMYIRQIFMPKGILITSKIHKTRHPFVILKGDLHVYSQQEAVVHYRGPCFGITRPGTRRLLKINEDTIWLTFHPAEEKTVDDIESRIIEPHINPLILHSRMVDELLGGN